MSLYRVHGTVGRFRFDVRLGAPHGGEAIVTVARQCMPVFHGVRTQRAAWVRAWYGQHVRLNAVQIEERP